MRILVTGADGFLGRYLIAGLPGHDVICASRRPMEGVEWRPLGDLAGDVDWNTLLQSADAVVHLANIAHQEASEDDFERVNHRQTAALCAAAKSAGLRQLVYVSSIYAQSGHTAPHMLTEADTPQPVSAYGRSKLAAEQAIAASGVPFTILRPVLVVGKGAKANAAMLEKLARLPLPLPLGSITAKRAFLSAENFATGVAAVLGNPRALGETFIMADREPCTVGDVIARMRAEEGRRPSIFALPGLESALRLIGAGGIWEKIGTPFLASPRKLIALGWSPSR